MPIRPPIEVQAAAPTSTYHRVLLSGPTIGWTPEASVFSFACARQERSVRPRKALICACIDRVHESFA